MIYFHFNEFTEVVIHKKVRYYFYERPRGVACEDNFIIYRIKKSVVGMALRECSFVFVGTPVPVSTRGF